MLHTHATWLRASSGAVANRRDATAVALAPAATAVSRQKVTTQKTWSPIIQEGLRHSKCCPDAARGQPQPRLPLTEINNVYKLKSYSLSLSGFAMLSRRRHQSLRRVGLNVALMLGMLVAASISHSLLSHNARHRRHKRQPRGCRVRAAWLHISFNMANTFLRKRSDLTISVYCEFNSAKFLRIQRRHVAAGASGAAVSSRRFAAAPLLARNHVAAEG